MHWSRAVLLAIAGLWFGGQPAGSPDSAAPEIAGDPVVVYASYADTTYLPALFEGFTKATGTLVIVRNGEPEAMVNDVIENRVNPPADVLLTRSVAGVWRAADEGALRPLQSAAARDRVATWLRDADGSWTALSYRQATVVYDPRQVEIDEISDLRVLAEPRFEGKLCLATVENSISLAVIAQWINTVGVRDTELLVRDWVSNLASPPFAAEADVLQAVAEGRCGIAVVSTDAYTFAATSNADIPYRSVAPLTVYADIEGLGIGRHARNPDGGRALIEWLLSEAAQREHVAGIYAQAVATDLQGPANVGIVAYYRGDALKLAERARYR